MLGMAQRPGFDARHPPLEADFDWLIGLLERRAEAGAADVWLHAGATGDELVFAFPADQQLTAAIKRLPGRRFDYVERTWVVPAVASLARAVGVLLAEHPWLTIGNSALTIRAAGRRSDGVR